MPASSPMPVCAIAVMAKASAPGRTKTRLAPPLTLQQAADLNTTFLQDIAENILQAGQEGAIAAYMAYSPAGSQAFFQENMPPGVNLLEAAQGNFGDCLLGTVQALLQRGHAAACVLNADSPTLPSAVLVGLAQALAAPGDRAVIGPAEDGGYYVLGLKSAHARVFEDIDWSTERVFAQTLARAAEIGLPVTQLPAWYDVDDLHGLRRLGQDLFGAALVDGDPLKPSRAPRTRRLLARMLEDADLHRQIGGDIEAQP